MPLNYDHHVIIKTLDHPARILFWELDDFLVMVAPVFIGICLGSLLISLLGFVLRPLYLRLKKRLPRGKMQHKVYWYFPQETLKRAGLIQRFPASHKRELIL